MQVDVIVPAQVGSLAGLFLERVRRSPNQVAYRQYFAESDLWHPYTWLDMAELVAYWQQAFVDADLVAGDRVAIMLRNCPEWVAFDIAALSLGLVTVPLYYNDRIDNAAYVLEHSGAKLLFMAVNVNFVGLLQATEHLDDLEIIIASGELSDMVDDERVLSLTEWLLHDDTTMDYSDIQNKVTNPQTLATIVYTSGTTGKPKGVMLSHGNILSNCDAISYCVDLTNQDVFLSFLPLSHMLERMGGCFTTMMFGCEVAFARSPMTLAQDLLAIRPTALVSVPKVYEQLHLRVKKQLQQKSKLVQWLFRWSMQVGQIHFDYQQERRRWHPYLLAFPVLHRLVLSKLQQGFGGRLQYAICGGAALSPTVSSFLISCGIPVFQGYGLTEVSPVVAVNTVKHNKPLSTGRLIPNTEVRFDERQEIQVKSPSVMLGYWQDEVATQQVMTEDGWYQTGDQGRIDEQGFLYITGRLKDIIIMTNGEKVSPVEIENAILEDTLFLQVMVVGEGHGSLSAIAVLDKEIAQQYNIDITAPIPSKSTQHQLLKRIKKQMQPFPRYAQVRQLIIEVEPWRVENGLLTPTLKMKRGAIMQHYMPLLSQILPYSA